MLCHINLLASLLEKYWRTRCSRHLIALAISLRATDSFVMEDLFRESQWEFIAYYDIPCSTSANEIFLSSDVSTKSKIKWLFSPYSLLVSRLFQFIKSSFHRIVNMQILLSKSFYCILRSQKNMKNRERCE